ncbi:MAG: MMPL family transporter [Vallitaleaceae bacterium]|nr:MMPL family transporter [Vallitaleaceae bacterium]
MQKSLLRLYHTMNYHLVEHAKLSLLISIFVILIGATFAIHLGIESNMEDLLPEDNVVLAQTKLFNQYFPSNETAVVVIESDADPAQRSTIIQSFLSTFERQIQDAKFVENSLFYLDFSGLGSKAILYNDMDFFNNIKKSLSEEDVQGVMSIFEALQEDNNSSLKEYFTSDASSIYLVFLKPLLTEDFVGSRDSFYKGVKEAITLSQEQSQTEELHIGLTGGAFIQDIEADTIAFEGMFSTIILTFLAILLFVLFAFRKILLPLSTSLPLLGGALLASAFAYLVYGSLNMFSVSFALLLLGLGIDFGVHILSRYLSERTTHSQKEALLLTLNVTGPSIILGSLTTAIAFYAFVIGKFKAFSQMGIISGSGVLILCVMMFTMMPGLILLLDHNPDHASRNKTSFIKLPFKLRIADAVKLLLRFSIKHPLRIPFLAILIVILLTPQVLQSKIIGDVSKIYPKNLPSLDLAATLEEHFDLDTNSISIYVSGMDQLEKVHAALQSHELIQSVTSVLNFLPEQQAEKLKILSPLSSINEAFHVDSVNINDLSPEILQSYVGKEDSFLLEITPRVDLYQPSQYQRIKEAVYSISGCYPVGMPVIMNEIVELVTKDIIVISAVCLSLIFIMLLLMFRKIKESLITILPLLLSLYTTIGLMNFFHLDINIFSIAAFPLIIGIGIDSSIHLMHRLKEQTFSEYTLDEVAQTGEAICITSFTTMIGFFSLTFINHPGMANLGFAVSIGMFVCLSFTLLLVPSLYKLVYNESKRS